MLDHVFIETPRLYIKQLQLEDFPVLAAQQKDPRFREYFGGTRSDEEIETVLNLLLKHLHDYDISQGPVYLKATGECIGRAGLVYLDFDSSCDLELGCFLMPDYWRQGYASELSMALIQYAFDILGKDKLYALIDPGNVASWRGAEKIGMKLEHEGPYTRRGKTKIVKYYRIDKE